MTRRLALVDLHPPPQPCGANTPVTWGELYLLLKDRQPSVAAAVLIKILELDAERAA